MNNEKLRETLKDLVFKHAKLLRLKAEYIVKFNGKLGDKAIMLDKLKLELFCLQKTYELYKEEKSIGKFINKDQVKAKVFELSANLRTELDNKIDFIKMTNEYLDEDVDLSLDVEIDNIFSVLIDRFNPDLNRHKEKEYINLFNHIEDAYYNRDLDELKIYFNMDYNEEVNDDIIWLGDAIERIKEENRKIGNDFPFTIVQGGQLDVSSYEQQYDEQIKKTNEEIEKIKFKIEELEPAYGLKS